jgi:hypothetical protein
MQAVENLFYARRSFVTGTSIVNSEPHLAYPAIHANESLWLDTNKIPLSVGGDLRPLYTVNAQGGVGVDTLDDLQLFDSTGTKVTRALTAASGKGSVQKIVRAVVSRGAFGEFYSGTDALDLRHVVHEGLALSTESLYRPFVEELDDAGTYQVLPDHAWRLDHNAGLITVDENMLNDSTRVLYVTCYVYRGRIGIPDAVLRPTADDIADGVTNRFMTRELFDTYLANSDVASLLDRDQSTEGAATNVTSSDDITEGVVNQFFTVDRFDDTLARRTLNDVRDGDDRRAVSADVMRNLSVAIGDVPEIKMRPLMQPPAVRDNTLYVENDGNETALYFNSTRLTGPAADTSVITHGASSNTDHNIGSYHGTFTGSTAGVHSGDVVGNVTGFVSDIGNHRIITSKLLGSGEGLWTGAINGDVVGKFEGYAKVVNGEILNAYSVTIGTYDATALMHIRGNDTHLRLSHPSTTDDAVLTCISTGALQISCNNLVAPSFECDSILCHGSVTATQIDADHINCVGITNSYYGIYETGVLEDVTLLTASDVEASTVSVQNAFSSTLRTDELFTGTANCSVISASDINCDAISVSTFHVNQLSFDVSQLVTQSDSLAFGTLSVASMHAGTLSSIGHASMSSLDTQIMSVGHAVVQSMSTADTVTQSLSTGSLLCLSVNGTLAEFGSLSTSIIHAHSLHTTDIVGTSVTTQRLSCADLVGGTSEFAATSCSVLTCPVATVGTLDATTLSAHSITSTTIHALSTNTLVLSAVSVGASLLSVGFAFLSTGHILSAQADIVNATTIRTTAVASTYASSTRLNVLSTAFIETLSVSSTVCESVFTPSVAATYAVVSNLSASALHASATTASTLSVSSGRVDGLSVLDLSCASLATVSLDAGSLSVHATRTLSLSSDIGVFSALSCGDAVCGELSCGNVVFSDLSCDNAVCGDVSCGDVLCNQLSAQAVFMSTADVSNINAHDTVSASAVITSSLSAAQLQVNSISVGSLLGVDLGPSQADVTQQISLAVTQLSLAIPTIPTDGLLSAGTIATLSVGSLNYNVAVGAELSVQSSVIQVLSVGTIHGLTQTVDLPLDGALDMLSASDITAGSLSCGTLIVENIVRPAPHISATTQPAYISTLDHPLFAAFSQEALMLGDIEINGSVYIRDTLFLGESGALSLDSVKNLNAREISVGALTVGALAGLGAVMTFADLLGSPDDALLDGGLRVKGNLICEGLLLSGARNSILNDVNLITVQGDLSVSGDIMVANTSLLERLMSLETADQDVQAQLAALTQRVSALE